VANPIVQRELLTTLRAPRSAWTLVATVGLLTFLTLALWPAGGLYSLGEQASHTLLNSVSLGCLLLALLIAPAFTATSLTSEKENASYDLLTHTLLRPSQIAWGKVVSAQLYLAFLVVAMLPILAATLFLGGTAAGQLMLIVGVVAGAAISTGLLGFAVSAWSRESFSALVLTYTIMLFWCTLPLLSPLLLPGIIEQVPFIGMATFSSPVAMMLNSLDPGLFTSLRLPIGIQHATSVYFFSCAGISLVCWLTGTICILLPGFMTRQYRTSRVPDLPRLKFPFVLLDPRRRKRLIGNWTNPILAKELRSKTFGQGPWIIRGMYATFTVSLVLIGLMVKQGMSQTMDLDILKLTMIAFQLLVVILLVPALLSGAVTQEVEQQQFDLLRQTLIKPGTFLLGKMFSVWLLILLLLIASIPMWWMMAYLESYQWVGTLVSLAIVISTLVLVSAVSLFSSCVARTTAAATAIAFVIVGILTFGTLIPTLMGNRLPTALRTAILSWNPFAAGLQAVSIELLKGDLMLWGRYLQRTLVGSAVGFILAWFFLHRRLRRQG
jgi:ABC-type transport system involved in multi-copper enzyme maturation permease subunit